MRRNIAEGEHYHIYNRGVDKRSIFQDKNDRERFLGYLYACNSTQNVSSKDIRNDFFEFEREQTLTSIGAYCLMDNHFHLLLKETIPGGISKFLQKVLTGYTMYFNRKYDRSGSLFESKYRIRHADSDRYLKYLFSYIHLNPFKKETNSLMFQDIDKSRLLRYKFSSLPDYLSDTKRKERQIISPNTFPNYFSHIKDLEDELFSWLSYEEEG